MGEKRDGFVEILKNWANASDQEVKQVKEQVRMTCAEHNFNLPEKILIHSQPIRRDSKNGQSLVIVDGTDSKHNQAIARIKVDPNGNLLFLSKIDVMIRAQFKEIKEKAVNENDFRPFPAPINDKYLIHCYDKDEPHRTNSGKAVLIHEETQKETMIDFKFPRMEDGTRFDRTQYNWLGWQPNIKPDDMIMRMPEYDHRYKGKSWLALFLKKRDYGENLVPCILCTETGKLRVAGNTFVFDYPYLHSVKRSENGKDIMVFMESDEPNEEILVNNMTQETFELDDLYTNKTGWGRIELETDTFDPY